jgi:hypothetical protein
MTKLLVLQHIACEPPAAYEEELRARGVGLERVELDEGEAVPDWRGFDGRAYGLQFHLEVTPELAADWGEVPAYRESLTSARGKARSTC